MFEDIFDDVSIETINKIESVSRFPFAGFMTRYLDFITGDATDIQDYYSGILEVSPSVAFDSLARIEEEVEQLANVFTNYGDILTGYDIDTLFYAIDDMRQSLITLRRYNRFAGSGVSDSLTERLVQEEVTMSPHQLIEDVERDIVGSGDPLNTWVDLALDNRAKEEDYENEGGYQLKINFQRSEIQGSFTNTQIADVIDSPIKLLGLDIDRHFRFTINEGVAELDTLSYEQTFVQSLFVLSQLRRGDNPFYPDDGFVMYGGTNRYIYTTLYRQMSQNFATDESILSYSLGDLDFNDPFGSSLIIKFDVRPVYGRITKVALDSLKI